MCCYKSKIIEQKIIDILERDGQIILYKVLRVTKQGVESIYSPSFMWKPGVNNAVIFDKKYNVGWPQGIHGYLYFEDAYTMVRHKEHVIVEVVCKKEDFMRAGHSSRYLLKNKQAVFTKATITQEEWDKIIPRQKELARVKEIQE